MQIPFLESYWRVGTVNGAEASLSEFRNVLENVTDFRFSGRFTDVREDACDVCNTESFNLFFLFLIGHS